MNERAGEIRDDERFERAPGLVARRIGQDYVLVPVRASRQELGQFYTLNQVGGFIFERLDAAATVSELVADVTASFAVDAACAAADLRALLAELEARGLARRAP